MSEPRQLPAIDDLPKSGTEVHMEDLTLTAAEIEAGERLGVVIDPDDDDDNGGIE